MPDKAINPLNQRMPFLWLKHQTTAPFQGELVQMNQYVRYHQATTVRKRSHMSIVKIWIFFFLLSLKSPCLLLDIDFVCNSAAFSDSLNDSSHSSGEQQLSHSGNPALIHRIFYEHQSLHSIGKASTFVTFVPSFCHCLLFFCPHHQFCSFKKICLPSFFLTVMLTSKITQVIFFKLLNLKSYLCQISYLQINKNVLLSNRLRFH